MSKLPYDVAIMFDQHDFEHARTVQFTHTMPSHWKYAKHLFDSGVDTAAMSEKRAGYKKMSSDNRVEAFLIYVIHGELRFYNDTHDLSVLPGMIAFLPDFFSLARYCPVDTWFSYIQLTNDPLWAELRNHDPYLRECDYLSLLILALGKMFQARELQTSDAQFEAVEYARFIVELIRRELRYVAKGRVSQISTELKQLIARIRQHPENDWTLTLMAAELGISKRSLGRLVKKEYGLSPMELVIQNRIEKAARFLTRSNMKIDEIADALNYSSTSSFSDLFERYTGKRPGKFRRDFRLNADNKSRGSTAAFSDGTDLSNG